MTVMAGPQSRAPANTTTPTAKRGTGKLVQVQTKPILAQQYGGRHTGYWVSKLPESWIPYIQLARLSPPASLALIYFPHIFGALLAAILQNSPPAEVLRTCIILLAWSLFFSNSAHAWNDLVDAPLDAAVGRTRQRPIPRGAISPRAALIFAASQGLLGASVLRFCLKGLPGQGAIWYMLPNVLGTIYYPYAKRHTHFAQFVLGLCLSWGVIVGCAAMGHEPFSIEPYLSLPLNQAQVSSIELTEHVKISAPSLSLMLASLFWTVIYDTIYAHQDLVDDKRLGLCSMAVLLGERFTKPVLSLVLCAELFMLIASGMSPDTPGWLLYTTVATCGCASSLGCMIAYVNLRDSGSCWWWFGHGFWTVGFSIAGGLVAEYLARRLFQHQ